MRSMEKKKVFFISAANSIHTVKWVNALASTFEIHLIYCRNHGPQENKINKEVMLHELPYSAPYGYYLNAHKLKKIYKEIKPDIINVHYASGYGTLARIAKIKPILLSIWGSDIYDFPKKSNIKRKILKKNVNYVDGIASTSNIMADRLKNEFPKLNKEIYITPFGVDIEKFKKININKDNENFNIGNIKTLEANYGIEYLILGVKKLIDKLNKNNEKKLADLIRLYIYGDGSQRDELEHLIIENNLSNNVFLKGRVPNIEVPEILNNLDVFCVTSNNESFGVAVVEAMACEIPVVATKTDGFCEVMENNITGYLVEKKNVEQIADKLEVLLRNKELRLELGKNGRKKVIENYNWSDNVNYLKSIYNKLSKEVL